MTKVRDVFKSKLSDLIDSETSLNSREFRFIDGGDSELGELETEYRYDERFFFNFKVGKSNIYNITACPGEAVDSLELSVDDMDKLFFQFKKWIIRTEEDIQASLEYQVRVKHEENIEKLKQQMGEIGKQFFTAEEAEKMKLRLEKLEKDFSEYIKSTESDKTKQKEELWKVKKEFERLKSDVNLVNKATWIEKFFIRHSDWIENPGFKKLLSVSFKGVVKLIESHNGNIDISDIINDTPNIIDVQAITNDIDNDSNIE